MLGKTGVMLRGEGDFVAGIVTAVTPVLEYDESSGQWNDTGRERWSVALFDGGAVRFVEDVDPDDFGDDTGAMEGRKPESQRRAEIRGGATAADLRQPQRESQPSSPVLATGVQPPDAPATPVTIPAQSDAPEIPPEHPTTGTEEATTVQPPATATEPQPQQ